MLEVRDAVVPDELPLVRAPVRGIRVVAQDRHVFSRFRGGVGRPARAYAPPAGRLLLAWLDGECAGCIALRPLVGAYCSPGISKLMRDSPDTAEVKRLYVPSRYRGRGVGRVLAECVIAEAAVAGYRRICLDTLPTMTQAIELYRSLGLEPVESYYENPVPGELFFRRELAPG